jgi:hypothetical protein
MIFSDIAFGAVVPGSDVFQNPGAGEFSRPEEGFTGIEKKTMRLSGFEE